MNNYKGDIIEESLVNTEVLKDLNIISTRVEKVTDEHKTPWLAQWTLHTVEIPENEAQTVAEEISQSLDYSHNSSWYTDYKNDTHHYIIYRDKIFFVDRTSTEDECRKLIKLGDEVMENAYPESDKGHTVALMTKSGNIYTGVSYYSDTETLTMHSEATALAHAAIHGEKDIVAITGPNCHICKQLIYESSLRSGIDVVVIVEEDNQIKQIPISKMMLYPWPERLKDEKSDQA